MEHILRWMMIYIGLPVIVRGYDCISGCGFHRQHPLVAQQKDKELCLVTIPDNPISTHNATFPCQIEIQANCTSYCQINLHFIKFQLEPCKLNLTNYDDVCNQVGSCEYVVLHEHGVDKHGVEIDEITRFHGDLTEDIYESRSNSVLMQFCYRSETFSARNIQIGYRVIDPNVPKTKDYGPVAVYVLGTFVVIFIIAIFMVQFCPWLRPCLDPQPQKEDILMDL